jgi:hypothetical protein
MGVNPFAALITKSSARTPTPPDSAERHLGERVSDLFDYCAVPLLRCLCGRSEQFPDACPRDASIASRDHSVDDLSFAARPSQCSPLQQILLNRPLVTLGRLVFLEPASQILCVIENLLNRTGHHITS